MYYLLHILFPLYSPKHCFVSVFLFISLHVLLFSNAAENNTPPVVPDSLQNSITQDAAVGPKELTASRCVFNDSSSEVSLWSFLLVFVLPDRL